MKQLLLTIENLLFQAQYLHVKKKEKAVTGKQLLKIKI